MTLFIDQFEYVDIVSMEAGVRMVIHGQDQQPFPEDNGFNILAGFKTSIALNNVCEAIGLMVFYMFGINY